mmetsp:Transcript_6930/g.15936  ORF Transcript_6930/g.15936 Transcript_6930/m.15936 type:complete len:255 (+) Transcript_6930:268-1032(+)
MASAPPVVAANISVSTWHLGQANPFMFSTTPRTGSPTFLQKLISFRTSKRAISCGVVTIIAPSTFDVAKKEVMDKCSSLVPGGQSTTRQSISSPQYTSLRNCLISPFFFGPRQITASFGFVSKNPTETTARFSAGYTGVHPRPLCRTVSPSMPTIFGTLGPQISISRRPICMSGSWPDRDQASCVENVLLPTPPFPESTRILWPTHDIRSAITGMSGSGPLGALAHIFWFGQPAQAATLPASPDSVPGQCCGAS